MFASTFSDYTLLISSVTYRFSVVIELLARLLSYRQCSWFPNDENYRPGVVVVSRWLQEPHSQFSYDTLETPKCSHPRRFKLLFLFLFYQNYTDSGCLSGCFVSMANDFPDQVTYSEIGLRAWLQYVPRGRCQGFGNRLHGLALHFSTYAELLEHFLECFRTFHSPQACLHRTDHIGRRPQCM